MLQPLVNYYIYTANSFYFTVYIENSKSFQNLYFKPLFLLFMILGIITQIVVTGPRIYHEEQFPSRKHPRPKPETREERKQRKYRYLYQVNKQKRNLHLQSISSKLNVQIFCMKVLLYFCQSQILMKEKVPKRLSYKKGERKTLMKLTLI